MADDFAFVYGKLEGDFHQIIREVFRSKTPPIPLIDRKKLNNVRIKTLHDCVEYLRTIAPPTVIGDLFLSTHASPDGVSMPMFKGQDGRTDFEVLEDTIKIRGTNNPAPPERRIDMTDILVPAVPEHKVRVFGCNIGKSPAFMAKWKEALGHRVTLIAPKHFGGVVPAEGYGAWEYLCYQFPLNSPTPLTAKQMRAAFKAKAATNPPPFKFIDETVVPIAYWDDPRWYSPDMSGDKPMSTLMSLPASIGRNSKTKRKEKIWVARGLLRHKERLIIPIPYDAAADIPNPDDETDCKNSMKLSIPLFYSWFVDTHDFPGWKRYGYDNIDDFIAGYTWNFEKTKTKDHPFMLNCTGRRTTYTVVQPITEPNPTPDHQVGKVLNNFFPKTDFDKIPSEDLPPDGLALDNDDLFLTV